MIFLREPTIDDKHDFLDNMMKSKEHFYPFVPAITSEEAYENYLKKYVSDDHKAYLVVDENNNLIGAFNLSQIVYGAFQNAYLGFYAFKAFSGRGLMSQGLKILLKKAFSELKLHRLEANIQPSNFSSIRLVKNNGFIKEGFAKNFLFIENAWRDHERWAITAETWQQENFIHEK